MGYTEEEDIKSDVDALRDNILLLKKELAENDIEQSKKRVEYIIETWFW